MSGVFNLIRNDLRDLLRNPLTIIVTIGLVLVPALYAWLNTWGFWNPYAHTESLRVAVANNDAGYSDESVDLAVRAGDQVIGALRANSSFDWEFVGESQALSGLANGDYYAAFVIPESFSSDLMSAFEDNHKQAHILYYVNQKENAITPHLTQEGASALQHNIDTAFAEAVGDATVNIVESIASPDVRGTLESYAREAVDALGGAIDQLESTERLARTYAQLAQATEAMEKPAAANVSSIEDLLVRLSADTKTARETLDRAKSSLQATAQIDNEEFAQVVDQAISLLENIIAANERLLNRTASSVQTAKTGTESAGMALDEASAALESCADLLRETSDDLAVMRNQLQEALDSQDLARIRGIIGNDPASFVTDAAQPVELKRQAVFPMASNGDAMSPFYTSLSIWIGAVFLIALLRVDAPSASQSMSKRYVLGQLYLGRGATFALLSLSQAMVTCVGNVLILGVQCEHPTLYFLAAGCTSLTFNAIVYTLVAAFGSVGKALAVLGMVMQVAGSGGIFPVQMSADFFQAIYPWLPFTHSIEALQGAMAGIWGDQYWLSIAKLVAYLAPTLVVGLGLRRITLKAKVGLDRALSETGIML